MLKGKNNKQITIISAYCTCRQGPSAGATTAHAQQIYLMEQERLKADLPSTRTPNPHEDFIKDLETFIKMLQAHGDGIILCIDANETPESSMNRDSSFKKYSSEALMEDTVLIKVFQQQHGSRPSSKTTTPNRFIDWIATWNIPVTR